MVKIIKQKKVIIFPNYPINRQEAKYFLGMTNKEIDKVEKSESGLLKIMYGAGFYLSKGLKYSIK